MDILKYYAEMFPQLSEVPKSPVKSPDQIQKEKEEKERWKNLFKKLLSTSGDLLQCFN